MPEQKKRRVLTKESNLDGTPNYLNIAAENDFARVRSKSLNSKKDVKKKKKNAQIVFSANKTEDNQDKSISPATVEWIDTTTTTTAADIDDLSLESDEEGERNRMGDVPFWWYDKHSHIGYDATGEKLEKTLDVSQLSRILKESDDSEAWRNITDIKNQTVMRLSDTDLEIIHRLQSGRFPLSTFDMYGPDSTVEFDNFEEAIHPSNSAHPPKRRFLPSLSENKRINKLVRLIRQGKIKVTSQTIPEVFDLWGNAIITPTDDPSRIRSRGPPPLPAPKEKLPDHTASYNPPEEYLMDENETKEFEALDENDRPYNYLPKKYSCLRHVPGYKNNILERFQRCLDLYLCPRTIRMRMNINPESLLPELPSLQELRPFPTRLSVTFETDGSRSCPTCMSFDATGTYLAIGRRSGRIEIFDVTSSRLIWVWDLPENDDLSKNNNNLDGRVSTSIGAIKFNPVFPILAVTKGTNLYLLYIPLIAFHDHSINNNNETSNDLTKENIPLAWNTHTALNLMHLNNNIESTTFSPGSGWIKLIDEITGCKGWKILHEANISSLSWHVKGMYLVSVCHNAVSPSQQLGLHSLGKLKTLRPFRSNPAGRIQAAQFHPSKNYLYVAYFKGVRLYNLQKQHTTTQSSNKVGELLKKFSGIDQVSTMDIHPGGDLIAVGGNNRRLTWFDYDLGEKPYKILRYHTDAVASVGFHQRYPLMFSCSDDGTVHLFHSKISTDILVPPAVIPLKKLTPSSDLCVNNLEDSELQAVRTAVWHPTQPWLAVGIASGYTGLFV